MPRIRKEWYIIVNPHAGSGKTMRYWVPAEARLQELGIPYNTVYTTHKRHAAELSALAARTGYRKIMAVGGDGSIHEVFEGVLGWCETSGTDPSEFYLAVAPIGSGNDWIKSFGVPKDVMKVLEIVARDTFVQEDVVRVTLAGGKVSWMANIGGLGFDASRRNDFLFPHTPIGMLRVYLWTHPEKSQYKVGEPSTWKGMRVGMLSGAISAQRAKRQFDHEALGVKYREYATDSEMVKAYFEDEIDACIDVEMPDLSNEVALHLYASHPMYICTSTKRTDLFNELEKALEEVCDDFPKYHKWNINRQMLYWE